MADSQDRAAVQVWGYRVLAPIPFVAVIAFLVIWGVLGDETDVGNRVRRFAVVLAALAMLPVFGAFTYRLRLSIDQARDVLTVTRRPLIGPGTTWEIPAAQLTSWFYAESIQSFVLRRHGERPLRFVIWMGKQPERLLAWAEWALPRHADPAAGQAASRRVKRILIISFGSAGGIVMLGIVALMIIMWS